MNIIFKTKGEVKLSDAVRQHFEEQLGPVERIVSDKEKLTVNVMLAERNGKYKAEITIVLKKVVLRAECNGDTLYAAFDLAADKIEQQLVKHKRKANAYIKKCEGINDFFVVNDNAVEKDQTVIKTKKIELTEMSIDEAITQMELVDHAFYLFRNEENHTVAVVYKRKDGEYGLIEEL